MAKHPREENQGAERALRASWVVHHGDVLDRLRELPDESVQCVVTSPPYWGLRDYGVEGMIGLEPTLEEHLAKLVEVFAEVRRVLRDDGTCWLNYGDAYAGSPARVGYGDQQKEGAYWKGADGCDPTNGKRLPVKRGLAAKQRLLMPARVALALQADGWWVRSEIVWAKGVSFCPAYAGSCMPSSVRDRPTDSHEMVYLLSKAPRYFYDADAVREASATQPHSPGNAADNGRLTASTGHVDEPGRAWAGGGGRNLRTVWTINPKGYKEAHFATFPPKLVEPCVKAGTSERGACSDCGAPWRRVVERVGGPQGTHVKHSRVNPQGRPDTDQKVYGSDLSNRYREHGTPTYTTTGWEPTCTHADAPTVPCVVLDPFSGSGTTGAVAVRLGRSYVGIELNAEYLALSRKRIGRAAADVGQGGTVTADEDERAAQLGLWS